MTSNALARGRGRSRGRGRGRGATPTRITRTTRIVIADEEDCTLPAESPLRPLSLGLSLPRLASPSRAASPTVLQYTYLEGSEYDSEESSEDESDDERSGEDENNGRAVEPATRTECLSDAAEDPLNGVPQRPLTRDQHDIEILLAEIEAIGPERRPPSPLGFGLREYCSIGRFLLSQEDQVDPLDVQDIPRHSAESFQSQGELSSQAMEGVDDYDTRVYASHSRQPTPEGEGGTFWQDVIVYSCASVQDVFAGIPGYKKSPEQSLLSRCDSSPELPPTDEDFDTHDEEEDSPSLSTVPLKDTNGRASNPKRRRRREEEDIDYVDDAETDRARRRRHKKAKLPNGPRDPRRPKPRKGFVKPTVNCPSDGCAAAFDGRKCDYNEVTKHFREKHDLEAHCKAYQAQGKIPCPLGGCRLKTKFGYFLGSNPSNMHKNIGRHIHHTHMPHPRWYCQYCDKGFDRKDAAQRHMDEAAHDRQAEDGENAARLDQQAAGVLDGEESE